MSKKKIICISTGRGVLLAALGILPGCGGSSPTSPSAGGSPAATNTATVVSCNVIRYQSQNQTGICAPIPNQAIQPSAQHLFFGSGRTDCLKATCSAGCVSSVSIGTVVQSGSSTICQ